MELYYLPGLIGRHRLRIWWQVAGRFVVDKALRNATVNVPAATGITSAEIITESGREIISADYYVLACNPFVTRDVLYKTPDLLEYDKELQKFEPLTADGPHVQISFQLIFGEKIYYLVIWKLL